MPTGVLMPVESMSMRVLMGIVQALLRPGICTASFIAVDQFIRRAAAMRDDFAVVVLDVHGGPFGFRLEADGGFNHVQRRGIGGGFGAAGLAENRFRLRETI